LISLTFHLISAFVSQNLITSVVNAFTYPGIYQYVNFVRNDIVPNS